MHSSFKTLSWCLVLLTASSSGGQGPRLNTAPISTARGQSNDTCPPDAESPVSTRPTDVVRIGEYGLRGVRYGSVLVDGQRAVWNEPTSTQEPSLGPDLDTNDIKSVEVVKPASARRAYGTCPGVGLVLITTKSKTWRPYARQGANPSSTDSVKVIVLSTDSLMATLVAYREKRISPAAAAKVIVDYMMGTGKPLNIQMDAALRDAVAQEMKARGRE